MWVTGGIFIDAVKEFHGIFIDSIQEFYQSSFLFCEAHAFMPFFWSFYIFLPLFHHLIPKKRFLDICTSSYHALTCDYREFHAHIALCVCGGSWAALTAEIRAVFSEVRPWQESPALVTLPQRVKPAPDVPPFGLLLVSVKKQHHHCEKTVAWEGRCWAWIKARGVPTPG